MAGSPLTTGGIQESFIESAIYILTGSNLNVGAGSVANIPFNTKIIDPYSSFNTTSKTFTASARGGLYQVNVNLTLTGGAPPPLTVLSLNAGSYTIPFGRGTLTASTLVPLTGGQTITVVVDNSASGSAITIEAGTSSAWESYFSIVRLGRVA